MELAIHLINIEDVLKNVQQAEKETGLTPIQADLKKVIQAVQYLLETHTLNKETLN